MSTVSSEFGLIFFSLNRYGFIKEIMRKYKVGTLNRNQAETYKHFVMIIKVLL